MSKKKSSKPKRERKQPQPAELPPSPKTGRPSKYAAMPVLKNAKHELFAQAVASGVTSTEAYIQAGYKTNANAARVSATRLLANVGIRGRITELLKRREDIEVRATEKAVEKLAVTKERILAELARIGFSDIRKVVKWDKDGVAVIDGSEVDDDAAAAIAEISQTKDGTTRIKLYDKKGALIDLGKHLGMFKEQVQHSGSINQLGRPEASQLAKFDGPDTLAPLFERFYSRLKVVEHQPAPADALGEGNKAKPASGKGANGGGGTC